MEAGIGVRKAASPGDGTGDRSHPRRVVYSFAPCSGRLAAERDTFHIVAVTAVIAALAAWASWCHVVQRRSDIPEA